VAIEQHRHLGRFHAVEFDAWMKVSKIMSAISRTKQPIKPHGIFYGNSERPRDGNSKSEAVVMRLKKMIAPSWEFGKELLLFCGMGALCGAAVGFLMYLHLGSFKNPEDAGYATGLFVKSGAELGFIVWVIHWVVLAIRRCTRKKSLETE
jgi:hypothetical protein